MYRLCHRSGTWPILNLDSYLSFVSDRLNLDREKDIALVLADDGFVQSLNMTYRQKNAPTNVLSFAAGVEGELGDLVFALETIRTEAAQQTKQFDHHFMHLVLHGSLHLLGYDHECAHDALQMETLEVAILEDFGLMNPYVF